MAFAMAALSMQPMVVSADKVPLPYNNPTQQREYLQRSRRVSVLWRSRKQRKVVQPLIAMLQAERTPHLREEIVAILGRLEDPQATPSLNALLVKIRQSNPRGLRPAPTHRDAIPAFRVQLALGRIRARNLRGKQKLNTIAQSVGSTWPGIKQMAARLRNQLSSPKTRYEAVRSDEYYILQEFYDVLYRMGKRNENIRQLGAYSLEVWPQREPLLVTAMMSNNEEIDFWLRRALPPSKFAFRPAHLLDLGPTVPGELMKYLRICLAKANAKPEIMRNTSAYSSMFKAAVATGDKRFLPILREFTKVNDQWTRIDAAQAIERLQRLS